MTGVPRSQSLISFSFSSSTNSGIFHCPDGYVTLVKSMYVQNHATTTTAFTLVFGSADGLNAQGMAVLSVASNAVGEWQGWFCLNPGDAIYVNASQLSAGVLVSGAVLAGPPQFPRV